VTANTNGVLHTLSRKEALSHADPPRHSALRAAAESLSLRNVDQSVVELFMEALSRLVDLCYEVDAAGLCNVDAITNRILIPLPFGKSGHAKWGLRTQESNILRAILKARQGQPGLFLYDTSRRSWHINRYDYESRQVAMSYLARYPITVAEFRAARSKLVGKS